jgi:hypothetical protein
MLDDNLFCSDVAVVSFVWAQDDIPEVLLPFREVGMSRPLGKWGGAGRFVLGCTLWGGESNAKV